MGLSHNSGSFLCCATGIDDGQGDVKVAVRLIAIITINTRQECHKYIKGWKRSRIIATYHHL